MKNIKNTDPLLVVIVTLTCFIIIVLLPIDVILIEMSLSDFKSEYIGLMIKMACVFLLSYRIIKKEKMERITGLYASYNWEFKYLNMIPVYLMLLGILGMISKDITQVSIENIVLLLFACLTVGFAEEFLFRGLLQSVFLKKYHARKHGIFIGTLFPAIIFGLFHLINLTRNEDVLAVLIQVVFATFIGFFFGVLVLKTNKIIPIAITHGLINFFFSIVFLPGVKEAEEIERSIAPIVVTLPLLIIGFFVLKSIKKEELIKKLNKSSNPS